MTVLRTFLGGKEDSQGPALWSKCPRSDCENGDDEGPDEGARVIAARRARCSCTRHFEESASIRLFLEPRKTRHKQGDGSKQLPPSQDREQVHRIAKVRYDLDDGLADHKHRSPMHQVRQTTCQKELLAQDVVNYGDGGGKVLAALRPVVGIDAVTRLWLSLTRKARADLSITSEEVNGQPAFISWRGESVYDVVSFEVVDAHIQAIRGILNPDKLAYIARQLRSHPHEER